VSNRYTIQVELGPGMLAPQLKDAKRRDKACAALVRLFQGIGSGTYNSGQVDVGVDDGVGGTAPSQTVTYVTPSGAQTITVGGVAIAFTAGVDAPTTALAAVAAAQASPAFRAMCRATAAAGVVTLRSNVNPRIYTAANGCTTAATGTGATAGGATMAGGVNAAQNGWLL
jgi:hypothetical protein